MDLHDVLCVVYCRSILSFLYEAVSGEHPGVDIAWTASEHFLKIAARLTEPVQLHITTGAKEYQVGQLEPKRPFVLPMLDRREMERVLWTQLDRSVNLR